MYISNLIYHFCLYFSQQKVFFHNIVILHKLGRRTSSFCTGQSINNSNDITHYVYVDSVTSMKQWCT